MTTPRRGAPWLIVLALSSSLASACASAPPAAVAAPGPAPAASTAPPPAAPSASSPEAPAAAPEPTADEKKKADAAREIQADRAKWDDEAKAELARWTPEMHADAKALAGRTYATGRAAIAAPMKGKHRKPGAAERDKYRRPIETLELFGFKPTMKVLDVGPGEGWYTELLAPALATGGEYVATTGDPSGPADERGTLNGQRFRAFLDNAPELYGKVQTIVVDQKAPKLGKEGVFDLVIVMRGVHGMKNNGTLDAWLSEIRRVLKPGGTLGIEEHRAKADADPAESSKKGYVPQKWLIGQIEAAGFKLAGASEVNANPKDTKDYPEGVWALPPTFRLGEKDHDKYAAIGESDRMTLKFVKLAKP